MHACSRPKWASLVSVVTEVTLLARSYHLMFFFIFYAVVLKINGGDKTVLAALFWLLNNPVNSLYKRAFNMTAAANMYCKRQLWRQVSCH